MDRSISNCSERGSNRMIEDYMPRKRLTGGLVNQGMPCTKIRKTIPSNYLTHVPRSIKGPEARCNHGSEP
jgi:hypothetical protein